MAIEKYTIREQVQLEQLAEERQNIARGLIAGIITGAICAIAWAYLSLSTGYQVSYSALILGAAIGRSMWLFGKSIEERVGIYAGLTSIGAILLGNFFILLSIMANESGNGMVGALPLLSFDIIFNYIATTFHIVDIVFYCMTGFVAYWLSYKGLDKQVRMGILKLNDVPGIDVKFK